MSKIDNALEQLIAAILESEEYREYDAQRNKVNQSPELKAQIDEFRKRAFLLQNDDKNVFEKLEQMENEYSDFLENSLVYDFLTSELAFCRMMQDINLRVTEAMRFE